MSRLTPVEGALHDRILDDTYPLWHDGLTRERYGLYNRGQMQTRWGARALTRLALVDRGHVLASAKRYDLTMQVDGRPVRTLGIGAVFTPLEQRRHGYAARLIEMLCEEAKAGGAGMALLFSEIGARYYERLGFRPVPTREVEISVRQRPGAPAMLVRSGDDRDLESAADMHNHRVAPFRLGLRYDSDWLQYSLTKKRLLAALGPSATRQIEFFVAEEGTQAVAWVLLHVTGRDRPGYVESWSLEGCGDRDPSGARVGAILQTLLARSPAGAPPIIRAWWPFGFEPPQLTLAERPSTAIVMMARALRDDVSTAFAPSDVLFWHGDAF
jgi:predicted N-acetyltransferase YhbS